MEIAALRDEVEALRAEKAELEQRLAQTEMTRAAQGDPTAAQAAEDPSLPPAPALVDGPGAGVTAEPLKPESVVAAAEAGTALKNAPDKPVNPAPRLVQPSFSSEEEAVFENEAAGVIRTASVLYGVHLASYRGIEEARAGWSKLQRENPDELGLLEPRIEEVDIEGRGKFLRLIGGGFSSREKAEALCKRLEAKSVYCVVSDFGGQKLSLAEIG
jgi:hypothetical protein